MPRFVQVAQAQLLSPLGLAQPSAVAWQPGSELPLVLPSLEGALHLVRGAPALSPTPNPILGHLVGQQPPPHPGTGPGHALPEGEKMCDCVREHGPRTPVPGPVHSSPAHFLSRQPSREGGRCKDDEHYVKN